MQSAHPSASRRSTATSTTGASSTRPSPSSIGGSRMGQSAAEPEAMPGSARQALVLDFGGVISRTLFETHALTEAALGLEAGTLGWRGPFAPETDPLWQSMQ